MKIGVIGAGAIGGWLASRLAMAGHQVTLLRAPERLAGETRRLLYRDEDGESALDFPTSSSLPSCDLLIVAVKAIHLADAAGFAGASIGPETLILPLQNGVPWWFMAPERLQSIDPAGSIGNAFPEGQVIGSVVHAAVKREGETLQLVHADRLLLGEPSGGTSGRIDALVKLFEDAGVPALADPEIRRSIWYKLWGNLTMNPLSALTGGTLLDLIDAPALKPFILDCMAECAAVGASIGCPIEESGEDRIEVARRIGAFKTSMLQDVEADRPIELEALVGAAREIAAMKGVATPNIDALYGMTRLMAEKKGLL